MKTITLFLATLSLTFSAYAQKVCNSPTEENTDPNQLVISKCTTQSSEVTPSRKIIKNAPTSRKRITNRFKTSPNEINSNLTLNSHIKTTITSNTSTNFETGKLKVKTILFDLVDEVPTFNTCGDKGKIENAKCFKSKIESFFAKKFSPENIQEDEVSGKVLIKFDISIEGKIENIEVLSSKKSIKLNNEVQNILLKLPYITPGKVNGLPVNVTYVFPINLTLD